MLPINLLKIILKSIKIVNILMNSHVDHNKCRARIRLSMNKMKMERMKSRINMMINFRDNQMRSQMKKKDNRSKVEVWSSLQIESIKALKLLAIITILSEKCRTLTIISNSPTHKNIDKLSQNHSNKSIKRPQIIRINLNFA